MGKTPQRQIASDANASTASKPGRDDSASGAVLSTAEAPASRLWAYVALGTAMLLWSGTFILIKIVLTAYHPFTMVFVRMLVSMAVLAPFSRSLWNNVRYTKGDWKTLLILVLAEPCFYFMFEGYALSYTSASEAAMIISMLPLCVGVGAFIFLRERLSRAVWWGFGVAVAGVALLTFTGQSSASAPNPLLGNLLEMGAVFMATGYVLCVRKLTGFPAFCIVAFQSIAGAIFFGVLTFAFPQAGFPDAFHWWPTAMLVALGFISVFGYGLFNVGVAKLSAGQASAWNNLIPGLTLIMGMFFLGERFTTLQYLALIPIFLGVAISQLGEAKIAEHK